MEQRYTPYDILFFKLAGDAVTIIVPCRGNAKGTKEDRGMLKGIDKAGSVGSFAFVPSGITL